MEEGTIARWCKKEGEFAHAGELLLEITTDKATVEHTALDEGWLRQIVAKEGATIQVNRAIAVFTEEEGESLEGYKIEEEAPPTPPTVAEEEEEVAEKTPQAAAQPRRAEPTFVPEPPLEKPTTLPPHGERVIASPLARKLAKERGLDLSTVEGTGPGGRITSHDLEKAQPEGLITFGRKERPEKAPGSYHEIPLTPMRKIISRRLQESKSYIPHFYAKQVIDAAPLADLREQLKEFGLKPTFNDLVIRGTALALRVHPGVNTGFHSVNQSVIQYETIDISVAVTLEEGLITPIIRHADFKNVGQISSEVKSLVAKAKRGKLQESEYKGGSFTVSNLGMFGLTEFSAVINPPQAAILAVGGIEEVAVVREGSVVPGKQMTLVLSADHRVVDGALAAQFLKTLQNLLQHPASLLL